MKAILLSLFATTVLFLSPVSAFAAYNGAFGDVCKSAEAKTSDVCKNATVANNPVTETIADVVDLVSLAAGSIAVIVIIVGGIRFVISSGEAAKVASARNTILYAVVGLIVIIAANGIINFVLTRI